MSAVTSFDFKFGSRVVLPFPLQELCTVWDSWAKGSWILVHVSSHWDVTVLKCHPGIRIVGSSTYDSHTGMTFIQCPNVTKKSVRFIAVGINKNSQSCRNEFTYCDDGIIHSNTFLSLVQGVFLSPTGELVFIHHKLRPFSMIKSSMSSLMQQYFDNTNIFCKNIFESEPTTSLDSAVSFLYLNQIGGPTLKCWKFNQNINIESGLPFLQCLSRNCRLSASRATT